MRRSSEKRQNPSPFSTSFGKFLNEAYISSDPLEIPKDDMVMRVEIDKGVHGQFSGQTEDKLAAAIAVPGMFNYFKFTQAQVTFARNERYEPEQVLILETIGEVSSEAVAKSIEVMLLPLISPDVDAKKNKEKKHYWRSTSEVTEAVKAQMTPVKLTLIPSEQEATLITHAK